jgi:hypothetical protein
MLVRRTAFGDGELEAGEAHLPACAVFHPSFEVAAGTLRIEGKYPAAGTGNGCQKDRWCGLPQSDPFVQEATHINRIRPFLSDFPKTQNGDI